MSDVNGMQKMLMHNNKRHILIIKIIIKTNYFGCKYIIISDSDDQNLAAVIKFKKN